MNLNLLIKYSEIFKRMKISLDFYLIDDHSMAVMIFPGKTIYKRSKSLENMAGCGILPLWIDC